MLNLLVDADVKILLSMLATGSASDSICEAAIDSLKRNYSGNYRQVLEIAKSFHRPQLVRTLNTRSPQSNESLPEFRVEGPLVICGEQVVGQRTILFKSIMPGELQARLTIESTIERFLEYLTRRHQIVVLSESDHHVQVFTPGVHNHDFQHYWKAFIRGVAFSSYGDTRLQMSGLVQTFIAMLNAITLSERGFSTLDIPILTTDQANVLAAWYWAVIQQVEERQKKRQAQIDRLEAIERTEKEEKELAEKTAMQKKEKDKYTAAFQRSFTTLLSTQIELWLEFRLAEKKLSEEGISKKEERKAEKQKEKALSKITFSEQFLEQKKRLLSESENNPFRFIALDREEAPAKFQKITEIAKQFNKKATDQINSTVGAIFTQCVTEMYRLMELENDLDELPPPLLCRKVPIAEVRSPGDDSKEFCYACGTRLDSKEAKWQVLRFMFERPSQRRQSSAREGRPHICAACSALAFASPLKVTAESIVLQLTSKNSQGTTSSRLKDYVRMLTNKELHLSAGKYILLSSDRTKTGELAAAKLGKVQYALLKVAETFPIEVLEDFHFQLVLQGSRIDLQNRHLLFISSLMEGYGQSIVTAGTEINKRLGSAVRYIQQDMPYLAEYQLAMQNSFIRYENRIALEKTRWKYWKEMTEHTNKRARLYEDVAALTGLTYAFVSSLESTAKKSENQKKDSKYTEREVSKIIEKSDDATAFCYYATLGDGNKKTVQSRLYRHVDNAFIYARLTCLLKELGIDERESLDEKNQAFLQLYADDIALVYTHFSSPEKYQREKDWKELTYHLKLSLYTRFPELVRKLKATNEQ